LNQRLRSLPGSSAESNALRPALALIALGALGVRLLYILVIARAPVGVGGDAGFYHSAANLIAHGHFYYRGIFSHAYVTAEHPPLYPLALSLSSLVGADSLLAHRVVSCVIGTAGVVLVGLLARRVAGNLAGLLASGIAAVYPPFITADGLVMSEPLFVVTVALALLAALMTLDRPSPKTAAVLGATIGLATLTRGEGILLVPLLAWPVTWTAATAATADGARARRRATLLAVTTAATAVVLAPWVIRNVVVFHRATLAADSNTVIAGANCPETYYGHDIGWWSNRCLERARTRKQLLSGDASTHAAFTYAGNHLTRLPVLAAVRVLRTFNFFQPLRQGNREPRRRWVDVVGLVVYYVVLALAVLGLRAVRRRDRWILMAPIALVVIVSALTWGIGRFRIAADISLIVLAAAAVAARAARAGRDTPRRETVSDPAPPARSATSSQALRQMTRRPRRRTATPSPEAVPVA
jgi:4-amino-4-deoxy-L-arabinose transferase-like glycosyltransferase